MFNSTGKSINITYQLLGENKKQKTHQCFTFLCIYVFNFQF
jgi:hypothetical protein